MPGRWQPVIVLRPPGAGDPVMRGELESIAVCTMCRDTQGVDDFVTDESWGKVIQVFSMTGRVLPDRSRTTLEWNDLEPPKVPT